jgi:hypothetical protein
VDVGDVETLSLSSENDLGHVLHHATGNNVTQVNLVDEDHFAIAASTRSFVEVYKYLRGEAPKYTEVQCGDDLITIEGLSETFADNVPISGKLDIHELGDTPRVPGDAVIVDDSSADGHFGPIQLKRNVPYEISSYDASGKRLGYQYFSPFKRSNRLVRLLSPSGNSVIAAVSTDKIVSGPNHMAVVGRWTGGGFRQDLGASLLIDGSEVLTDENAGASTRTTTSNLDGGVVGFFMYDANTNGQTDLGLVSSSPDLAFTDVFMSAATPRFTEFRFIAGSEDSASGEIKMKVPNWPSSDATVFLMFQ